MNPRMLRAAGSLATVDGSHPPATRTVTIHFDKHGNFAFSIHRTFKRGGKKQSYLLARCANRRFRAHAVMQTDDGTRIAGGIVRHCASSG